MATGRRDELYQAVKAHISALEIEREAASWADRARLDRRIEDARLLLEWISAAPSAAHASSAGVSPDPGDDSTPDCPPDATCP
jgi:hypothetical protein